MPRKPRFFVPGVPVHIVQRGHSRQAVFYEDNDYLAYLRWLKEGAKRYQSNKGVGALYCRVSFW